MSGLIWIIGMEKKVHMHEVFSKKYMDIDNDGKREDYSEPWGNVFTIYEK